MVREISQKDFDLKEDLPNGTLKVVQFVTLLDLVSDGAEIEGFSTPSKNSISIPTGLLRPANAGDLQTTDDEKEYIRLAQKDIFLNGRPIRSSAGIENIKNTSLAIRVGQQNQQVMTGIDEFKQNGNLTVAQDFVLNNKNKELNKKTGLIYAPDPEKPPTAVIVTLTWPRLGQIDLETGTTNEGLEVNFGEFKASAANFNNAVQIRIRLRSDNGSIFNNATVTDQIDGRSIGQFSKDFRVEIPSDATATPSAVSTHFPISVEVLRDDVEFRENNNIGNNPFSGSGKNRLEEGERRFTSFRFTGLQAVIKNDFENNNFPDTAYIGLRYSAEQFPNIPQRKYFIRGIKVKIPYDSNTGTGVTVDVGNTGGILYPENYSFSQLTTDKYWTSDPVWILYALLTENYGLGISDLKVDKASFYLASSYCATPVLGEKKPRYSFNGVIKARKKAINIIREIAGMIRATLYYRNGSLKIAIDKPETVVSYLFTNANVVDGLFNYSGVDKDKKFNQINVAYFNNDIQDQDQISVKDQQLINNSAFGLNQLNIQSLYTTDKDQAKRFGRSILYTSNFETEIVTFECGIEAACILEPFQIIKIADRTKETIRASGRIKTVTSSTVLVVDDSTDTTVGTVGDVFSVIDKDGGVQERTIQSINGSTVTLSSAYNPQPQAGAIWAVKTGNVQHRKYRVTNIKQKDNFVFSITAIIYDDNKYEFIDSETGNILESGLDPTTLLDELSSPEITQVEEQLVVVNSRAQSQIVLDFSHVNGARSYQVAYTINGGDPIVNNVTSNQFIIKNNKAGTYQFFVRSVNALFQLSDSISTSDLVTADALKAQPNPVTNLRAEESGDNLILKFDRSTDLDVLFGGNIEVKYALISDGTATIQNSNFLKEVEGNVDQITINDYQSGEYFLKFIDVAGNKSVTATSVVVNRTIASNNLLAGQIREDTNNFAGSKVNLEYDNNIGGLKLSTVSGSSEISNEGAYTFANDIDLGAPFRLHVEPHFKKSGFNTANLWDSYTDNINDWPDIFTGSPIVLDKSADLVFQVAKSQTGTASTTFETFVNTDMIARTLSFKVLVQNQSTYENVDIEELGVNLIFRPRTERSIDNSSFTNGVLTSSGTGATTVTFAKKFFLGTTEVGGGSNKFKPVVSININNMQDGDFFTIDSVSSENFVVSIKNDDTLFGGVGTFVQREFTYSAFGYGEG